MLNSDELYRLIIETTNEGIWIVDLEARTVFANQRMAEILGCSVEEMPGSSFFDFIFDGDLSEAQRQFEEKKKGNKESFDFRFRRKDGSETWVHISSSQLREAQGAFMGILSLCSDITERKRAEEALRATEQRFTRFMQHLPGLAWIKDLQGRYVYANEATEKAFRKPRAELYGKTDDEVFPPETAAQFKENDRRALISGTGILTVETLEHEDGVLHHSIVSKFPILGADGKAVMIGGVAIDITDRKRAEEELQESEARFRALADSAPVLIWMSGPAKEGVYFNKGWLDFTGRTLEQELGEGWLASIHPDDRDSGLATCAEAFQKRQPFQTQFRLRRADGQYRWVLDTGVPRFAPEGTFLGYIGSCLDITERKEAEEALERERELLQRIIDTIPVMITLYEPNTKVLRLNREFDRVVGWSTQDVAGVSLMEACYPNPEYRQEVQKFMQSCCEGWMDIRMRTRDGREIETSWANIRLSDATQIGIGLEIGERKRAEEALRESEARYRVLAETALDGIITIDEGSRILFVNEAGAKLFGYTIEELLGQQLTLLMPEELRSIHVAALRRYLVTGQKRINWQGVELEGRHKTGKRILLEISFNKFVKDGKYYFTGILRDITERKRAEQALRESEERERARAEELTALMEAVPAVVWIAHDPACRTITGSRTAHELLRMPMGANLSKTAPQGEQPIHFKVLREGVELAPEKLPLQVAARGVEVRDFEEEVVFDDGTRLHLYGNAVPLRDRQGRVRGAIGAFIDITERKRFEEALKEADRRKDEFLAMLAHELRNPLAPIRNAVQVMRFLSSPDPKLQWARDIIDRQVEHLTRLVEDLLDISRITRGKVTLQKEKVELEAIIARAVETSRPLLDARRHQLILSLPPQPVQLEGDLIRLAQVLANLLNNAAKYTKEGGCIWLSAELSKGEVILKVRDTGIGIPRELLPHVFDLFIQADRSLARSQGGLGIGLTLVRSLVEMHGGKVEAFSDGPGQGSEFVVRLPASTEPEGDMGNTLTVQGNADSSPGCRVLVVDDNVDSAESMALLLQLYHYPVRVAYDGPTALEIARAFQPQVILLDIGLPGMDGYEVARRLRQQPQMQGMILIALTGYGQAKDRERSKEAGFDDHLVKPVDPNALQALITSLRAARRPSGAL